MPIENNNINPGALDKKKLLDELAIDIANKFGIDKEKAVQLIKFESTESRNDLKKEIININNENTEKQLSNKEIDELFNTIKGAKEVIEKFSSNEIQVLKKEIEKSINIDEFKNHIEDYLPPKLINKAKNPKYPHEHVLGFALGTANSIVATADILYQIGAGLLKAPYHMYMIITGKGKSESFKDV